MEYEPRKLPVILIKVFLPVIVLTVCYAAVGLVWQKIPALLLFFVIAAIVLFPAEPGMSFRESKKQYGKYSLKSALANQQKINMKKKNIGISIAFHCICNLFSTVNFFILLFA